MLHWLVHHELSSSSALVSGMISPMSRLRNSFRGLSRELPILLFLLMALLLQIEVIVVLLEILLRWWHCPRVSPALHQVRVFGLKYL